MARLDDIKMMLSSLLKVREPAEQEKGKSDDGYNAEDGYDNDNPLALTSLYRDEMGNRLPNKLHVIPLAGAPILPSQLSSMQLNIEWLDIITEVISSSHHTFAMFGVDNEKAASAQLNIDDFPKTGTVVRLLSARTGPEEIDIVCEGVRRVSLIEVSDSKKNLAQVRYPEIEYRLANAETQGKDTVSRDSLRESLNRTAALDNQLKNLLKEQKEYARSIGIDVVKKQGSFDFDYYIHSDERVIGRLSRSKFKDLLEFLAINDIPEEQKEQIALYLARPSQEEIDRLNEYYQQAVAVIKERSGYIRDGLARVTGKIADAASAATEAYRSAGDPGSDSSAATSGSTAGTGVDNSSDTSDSAAVNAESGSSEPGQEVNRSLKDLAEELTHALRSRTSQKESIPDAKMLVGGSSNARQAKINEEARASDSSLNQVFIDRMNFILDDYAVHEANGKAPGADSASNKNIGVDEKGNLMGTASERLFKMMSLIDRREELEDDLAQKRFKKEALNAILENSPSDKEDIENAEASATGPNFGFVNEDTAVITFMPGHEASEDLLMRLNEIQKEHELALTRRAQEEGKLTSGTDTAAILDSDTDESQEQTSWSEELDGDDGAGLNILGKTFNEDGSTQTSITVNSDNQRLNPELKEFLNYLMQGKDIADIAQSEMGQNGKKGKWAALQRAAMIRNKLAALLGGKVIFGVSTVKEDRNSAQYDVELRAYCLGISAALQELIPLNPLITDEMRQYLARFDMSNPSVLADCGASLTQSKPDDLQKVLDTIPVLPRLRLVFELISRELSAARLHDKIKISVAEKIQKRQKDFFLREQLNEIKKELGLAADEKDLDVEKFKERMKKLSPPDHIKERFEDEITKLSLLETASPEYGQTRNYIDILTSIPWGKMAKEKLGRNTRDDKDSKGKEGVKSSIDLNRARRILDEDHEGLQDVKDRIIEFLAVGALKGHTSGQIMLFVGPPGVGKTSIGKSIARALNRPFYRLSLGGIDDVSEIKGHRRTYVGSMPGKIVSALRETKVMNPVIMLDEIDKLGRSYHGDPDSALLETLDPEQNKNFLDVYLDEKLDLSNCLFICTANGTDTISAPLLDRMDPIRLSGYIAREKFAIAKKHLLPRALDEAGLKKNSTKLRIPDATISDLIDGYARESGVRSLERAIAKLIRKSAVKLVEGESKVVISSDDLEDYLGTAPFKKEKMLQGVGIMTGLAWTASGGVTLPVESIITSHDTNGFKLTGSLGDVMKESASIAYSYVQSHLEVFCSASSRSFFKKKTVHVHVPEGAIPKDGPSAGVTMATSLLSLVLNQAPAENYAMTGELTLTGHVLPIGGLREKTIAARRMGIMQLIIPVGNEGDVKELPEQVRSNVTFYYADTYKDVAWILFESVRPAISKAFAGYTGPRSVTFDDEGNALSENSAKKDQPAAKTTARATRSVKTSAATGSTSKKATSAKTADSASADTAAPVKSTRAKSGTSTGPATKAKAKAKAKAEPKPSAKSTAKAPAKAEAKPAANAPAKAEAKPAANAPAKAEAKPAAKATAKAAVKSAAKTSAKAASSTVSADKKPATKASTGTAAKATTATKVKEKASVKNTAKSTTATRAQTGTAQKKATVKKTTAKKKGSSDKGGTK